MRIGGLQKLTLLDYPGKIACTVFIPGCNFRCPFCHNAELVINHENAPEIDEKEFFEFLEKRRTVLEGVCVSGGEPLLQKDIFEFIAKIKDIGYAVKLDTNGSLTEKLGHALEGRLVDYVAMDIKNSPEKYSLTTGLDICNVSDIIESARILMDSGVPYEFRTTVVREFHDDGSFLAIGKWLRGSERYYLQMFEDSGRLISSGLSAAGREDMERYRRILSQYVDVVEIRGV